MVFSKGSSSESSEESPKMFATKASAILTVYNCVCVYSALLLNNNTKKKKKVMLICEARRHRRKSLKRILRREKNKERENTKV